MLFKHLRRKKWKRDLGLSRFPSLFPLLLSPHLCVLLGFPPSVTSVKLTSNHNTMRTHLRFTWKTCSKICFSTSSSPASGGLFWIAELKLFWTTWRIKLWTISCARSLLIRVRVLHVCEVATARICKLDTIDSFMMGYIPMIVFLGRNTTFFILSCIIRRGVQSRDLFGRIGFWCLNVTYKGTCTIFLLSNS